MIIEVYMDYVIAFGQRIERPVGVPRSHWMDFWNKRRARGHEVVGA